MLCFNEIKLRGDGARRWWWPGLKGTEHIFLPCPQRAGRTPWSPPRSCARVQGLRPRPGQGSGGSNSGAPTQVHPRAASARAPRLLRPLTRPGHLGAGQRCLLSDSGLSCGGGGSRVSPLLLPGGDAQEDMQPQTDTLWGPPGPSLKPSALAPCNFPLNAAAESTLP